MRSSRLVRSGWLCPSLPLQVNITPTHSADLSAPLSRRDLKLDVVSKCKAHLLGGIPDVP